MQIGGVLIRTLMESSAVLVLVGQYSWHFLLLLCYEVAKEPVLAEMELQLQVVNCPSQVC
jgi:hypothetical protein